MNDGRRIAWIDTYKGIAILFVIWGHCRYEMNYLSRLGIGCHMPAFFFIAGLTLTASRSVPLFVFEKCKTIAWPLLTGSIVYWLCFPELRGRVLQDTVTLDGFGPLWFLSTYFFAIIMARVAIGSKCPKLVFPLLLAAFLCYFIPPHVPCLLSLRVVYMPLRIVMALFLIIMGWVLRPCLERIRLRWLLPLAVGYFILAKFCRQWYDFDLHYALMPSALSYLTLAFLGIGALVIAARLVARTKLSDFMQWMGRNSLCLMVMHWIMIVHAKPVVVKLGFSLQWEQALLFLIVAPWSIGMAFLIARIFPKFSRWS